MDNPLIIRKNLSPRERARVDERVRVGHLATVLPGAYTADAVLTWQHRCWAALGLWPTGVLSRQSAARLDFWPELVDEAVHLDNARRSSMAPWLRVSTRRVPEQLITTRSGMRVTATPLTILDLIDDLGGAAIDEGLRRRRVSLASLREALEATSWRKGNQYRRRLVHESRDSPWSQLERDAHQCLRRHRISGWWANYRVQVRGLVFYIDIAFPGLRLAIEMDGWVFHRTRADMERDARRHNWLQYAGWTVLRFTHASLEEIPEWVRRIERQRGRLGAERQSA